MKNYLKSQLKNLPMIIIVSIIFCGINTLATNYAFKAKEVEFDNSNTNIGSTNVGDAIDELYTAANNFATYDTRLQGVETTIGTGSLTTTSQTLIGGVNELKTNIGTVPSGKTTQGQIDALNSKIGNGFEPIPGYNNYYNPDTDRNVESNRAAAIKYFFANFILTGKTNTGVIRYQGGYYYEYLFWGTVRQAVCFEMSYSDIIVWWKRDWTEDWVLYKTLTVH